MRLATIKLHGAEVAGIVTGKGILPVAALNAYKGTGWKEDMMSLIQANHIPGLTKWYNEGGKEELESIPGLVPTEEVVYAPLYRNPKRIFGIGLNYADHAKDIGNAAPTGFPGSFFKMADTLVGYGDDILLPKLKDRSGQLAGSLSGGEQQMLAIGRAMMGKPRMLLLDEPSLGLAPLIINEIFAMVDRIREMGTTILLVEQNARIALKHSDRAYVLETGSIVLSDRADQLLESDEVRKAYFGGL